MTNKINIYRPSIFKGMYATNCSTADWSEIATIISGLTLKDDTEKYRYFTEHGLNDDAQAIKRRMMAFTPAVECNGGRKANNFVGLTGVGMCDFDHVADVDEAFAKAKADKHAFLVYRTISGHGIRVLFRYLADGNGGADGNSLYPQAFKAGNEYFAKLLGAAADGQCKNVGRLSVLCHDAEAVLNEACEAFVIASEPTKAIKSRGRKLSVDRAANAVEKRLAADGIVYAEGSYNSYVSRMGYYLNLLGISETDATEWAVASFSDYNAKEVKSIIASCYQHNDEHATLKISALERGAEGKRTKREGGYASVSDIADFLKENVEFRFNVITHKTEFRMDGEEADGKEHKWENLTDRDVNSMWYRMSKGGKLVKNTDLHNVIGSEFVESWNPFEDYFKHLPEWDGHDYIGETAAMVHVMTDEEDGDSTMSQQRFVNCFRKWLVATVASLMEEDVVNNVILVLIGQQGIFKTTFFNYLLPKELRQYFFTKTNSDSMSKDDRLALAEFAIICLEEIDSMRTPELNQLKALVTTKSINERAAYGRNKENRAHIASFCGTGNNTQFLTDQTGNRRWLPFEVSAIDNPMEHKYDYDGLYSQALALWKSGERYWFDKHETQEMVSHITHFEVPNIEEELISTYYRVPKRGEDFQLVSATNIIEHVNTLIKRALSSVKVGIAMKKLGFTQVKSDGKRFYKVVTLSIAETNSQRKVDINDAKDQDLPF